jgi:hypothetical protein
LPLPFVPAISSGNGRAIYKPNFRYTTSGSGTNIRTGVNPASGVNVAGVAFPAEGALTTEARCIQLLDFYYGCTTTNIQGTANVPLPCEYTLSTAGGQEQTVSYTPDGLGVANMQRAAITLPPTKRIQFTVALTNEAVNILDNLFPALLDSVAVAGVTGLVDNVRYI